MRPPRVNPNLHPNGGFKFIDADGVTHLSNTLEKLIAVVTHYRSRSQRPAGDPQTEIEDQLCKRHRGLCRGGTVSHSGTTENTSANAHLKRVLAIMVADNIRKGMRYPGAYVTQEEAEQRAAICAACPHAVNWTAGCGPCAKMSEGATDKALAPRKVVPVSRDLACARAKDSLELAIWRVNGRMVRDAPAACWRPATASTPEELPPI